MLDREFDLDVERLGQERADTTSFFAFADYSVAGTIVVPTSVTAGWDQSSERANDQPKPDR